MDFLNQNNYCNHYGYTDYPEAINPMEIASYFNNNTYYRNNLRGNNYGGYNTYRIENPIMNSDLENALNMIKDSVMDEANDKAFYTILLEQAITDEDKDLIKLIRDNEVTHNKILRDLYYTFTGITLPPAKPNAQIKPMPYLSNLKKALMGEVEAAERYRKILAAMPDKTSSSSIMHILVDELRHASLYNYLISKTRFNMLDKSSTEPTD
ncbi:MAG: ferritin-like domain-containing protein [Clostridia bacterium]|nr:ferritin-like domain-containing protein [Clostridia bacterium]